MKTRREEAGADVDEMREIAKRLNEAGLVLKVRDTLHRRQLTNKGVKKRRKGDKKK